MTSISELFTCVTCHVGFRAHDQQCEHYKSDWHRYNLKRKVADMPPVTYIDFSERAKLQKAQEATVRAPEEMFCQVCNKHFTNENSFANHKQSKKHKDRESAFISAIKANESIKANKEEIISKLLNVKSDHTEKKIIQMNDYLKKHERLASQNDSVEIIDEEDETDQNWEDVGEDDESMDQFDESQGIPLDDCFFCDHKLSSIEEKCEHMAKVHSFFIPDMGHVCDLEGLIKFLGIKIGVYHVCLWCSTKCYRNVDAVNKHMIDKGHQKMKFEGETLLEYADFYSFDGDTTVEDEFEMLDESSYVLEDGETSVALYSNDGQSNIIKDNDNEFELVLPSGTRLGHRSLFKYYKQSFGHRNLELKAKCNIGLRDKYLAISMGQNYTVAETKKAQSDMAYFKRNSQKWKQELGSKSNKLMKYFRRQDICF